MVVKAKYDQKEYDNRGKPRIVFKDAHILPSKKMIIIILCVTLGVAIVTFFKDHLKICLKL